MRVLRAGILAVLVAAATAVPTATAMAGTDTTPPFVLGITSGPPGDNGWFVGDVSLVWSVSDAESPVWVTEGCEPVTITTDQAAAIHTCTASSDGGTTSVSTTIRRDATGPAVALVGGPQDGARYDVADVPPAPTCDASDATAGLAGPCTVGGYGTAPGVHTVTATATDLAGNTSATARTYEVVEAPTASYLVDGFGHPVTTDGTTAVGPGRTLPLRFRVAELDGRPVTATSVVEAVVDRTVDCQYGDVVAEDDAVATGGTSLRHDPDEQQFVFNWQVPTTGGSCHEVAVVLTDGQELTAAVHVG